MFYSFRRTTRQKTLKLVYMKFLRYKNAESHELRNRTILPNACILSVFTFLFTKPQITCKTSFLWEKMTLQEKCLLSLFERVRKKSRAITLHGNKTNFYQKLAFKCF